LRVCVKRVRARVTGRNSLGPAVASDLHSSRISRIERQHVGMQADRSRGGSVGQVDLDTVARVHMQYERIWHLLLSQDGLDVGLERIHLAWLAGQHRQRSIKGYDCKGFP